MAIFNGGSGNDLINGTEDNDVIKTRLGNDTVFAAGGDDAVRGGKGEDWISGGAGNDTLRGDNDNDTLVGDRGSDLIEGGKGDDLLVWNNGDGSDIMEGGFDYDTVQVNGAFGNGDNFELRANGHRAEFERLNLVNFELDVNDVEQFEINGLGGDDTLTVQDLTGTDVQKVNFSGGEGNDLFDASLTNVSIMADGGAGDDTLNGSNGLDTLIGGEGSDSFVFDDDPFKGNPNVVADDDVRQVVNQPYELDDFTIADDLFVIDAQDFNIEDSVEFVNGTIDELTGLAQGGTDANIVVVQDGFANAGAAASAIAETGVAQDAGAFIYFNENLQINRLVYSEDLGVGTADISILGNINTLNGDDALNALPEFSEANFAFQNETGLG
ncbi:conserved hypothetical protein [Hyella patelloides LEGE 07179]|uniref:Calcium-binding protein n=1 Tax=Hyella patelloides LEGE 07179 TaxID=945734 RepID=A0A563VP60_9CYAN|nr:calcium-binding protein [Hyella patelloides]VEP13213.1 conserved hypothetical protein [Hyella patelloides LEGE 07179]